MSTHMPPVPPSGRSPQDKGHKPTAHDAASHKDEAEEAKVAGHDKTQGNVARNTRNQGFRHDPSGGAR